MPSSARAHRPSVVAAAASQHSRGRLCGVLRPATQRCVAQAAHHPPGGGSARTCTPQHPRAAPRVVVPGTGVAAPTRRPVWAAASTAAKQQQSSTRFSNGWIPLMQLVEQLTAQYLQQQGLAADASSADVLQLIESHRLLATNGHPLYAALQEALRGVKVRTLVGDAVREGPVSYLDPRCPGNITHPGHLGAGTTTSQEALRQQGYTLQHPSLPCVAIFIKQQQMYKTYPLECCWYNPSKPSKPGVDKWDCIELPGSSVQCRTAMWLEPVFAEAVNNSDSTSSSSITGSALEEVSSMPGASFTYTGCLQGADPAAVSMLRTGFSSFTSSLNPSDQEKQLVAETTQFIQEGLTAALDDMDMETPSVGRECRKWNLSAVRPVGSSQKKTSLRGKFDLDLVLELNVNEAEGTDAFFFVRHECLQLVSDVLCSSTDSPWRETARRLSRSFVHGDGMKLDVQVCPSLHTTFGNNLTWRQQVIEMLTARRHQLLRGVSIPTQSLSQVLTNPAVPVKEREVMLTPVLTGVVTGIQDSIQREFGLQGAGSLVTTVVRALKAWAPYRPAEPAAGAATAAAAGVAGQQVQGPPGCVWEIVVIYVLRQRLGELKRQGKQLSDVEFRQYSLGGVRELSLFIDVLSAASTLLRPGQQRSVVALTDFYSLEECELFRDVWGSPAEYTPFILHPGDPSYNLTMHSQLTKQQWEALADAAGELHGQLLGFLRGGAGGCDDVWQAVLDSTSLGPAVKAFAETCWIVVCFAGW